MPIQSITTHPHNLWMKYDDKEPWLNSIKKALSFYFGRNNKPPSYIGINTKDIKKIGMIKGDILRGVIYKGYKIRIVVEKTCLEYHLQLYQ